MTSIHVDEAYRVRVTKGGSIDSEGLIPLRMALWQKGKELDHVTVVSGQPNRQNFRIATESHPGSMEPIPEGHYKVSGPFWANGAGNFNDDWAPGLGPVVFDINNAPGNATLRAELRIHQDSNEEISPGTAGCLGVQGEKGERDFSKLKLIMKWFSDYKIVDLEIDYGLGSIASLCIPKK